MVRRILLLCGILSSLCVAVLSIVLLREPDRKEEHKP